MCIHGQTNQNTKDSSKKVQETEMVHGFQIIMMKTAIDMRVNIGMITKMGMEFTDGKMEQFMKDSF